MPSANDKLVARIRALDDTWHRPFTTLELAALQSSFGALLAGDADALRAHYRIDAQGTRERWKMQLVPRDARLAAKLRGIVLHGDGDDLRCIETTPAKGEVQRTLMGATAQAAGAGADIAALCRGTAG